MRPIVIAEQIIMFDDLAAYYHENVVDSYVEYRDFCKNGTAGRSRDLRAAMAAASALFHLREHLPGAPLSRADVERLCPDYALLGDIANASKHKALNGRTPHGAPLVTDASNLTERVALIEYEDDAGTYRFAQKMVMAKLSDGTECNLLEILTAVINFWEEHMCSIGVLSQARVFKDDSAIRYRSRTDCEANQLNFEVVKGQRFHQNMQLLRFDRATGSVTPVDLTGCKIECRIYKPKFDLTVSLTHKDSGKIYKADVSLTEEQSVALSRMASDEERQAFINDLPAAQAALQQLVAEARLGKHRR